MYLLPSLLPPVAPTVSDTQVTRTLDHDSGRLSLMPVVNNGEPPAEVQWYHNEQLLTSGVNSINVPLNNPQANVQAADRGIYRANISNDFGSDQVEYRVTVTNCELTHMHR